MNALALKIAALQRAVERLGIGGRRYRLTVAILAASTWTRASFDAESIPAAIAIARAATDATLCHGLATCALVEVAELCPICDGAARKRGAHRCAYCYAGEREIVIEPHYVYDREIETP